MERITGKEVKTMMEAYASVYKTEEQETLSEGYGKDCVKKEKKTKHNCAKKVCSEQWGEGTCIPEQHTLLDDGTVTHYDVMFEHGVEKMVPVEELDILVTEMHEHAAMEGEELQENQAANRARQQRLRQQQNANRPEPKPGPVQTFRDRIFARRSASPAAQANTNRYGQNIKVGPITGPAQNNQLKKPTATGTAPAAPGSMANKAPAANPNTTSDGTKFERRLPTSAELRAAQQARKDAPKVLSRGEIENRAVKAGVGVAKGTVKDPKIAADAARKAELAALQAKAKADTMKKKPAASAPAMSGRARMREELDVFDTIKEYLIGEGATEEEALKQMLQLTDEQRTEILEADRNRIPFSDAGEYPMRDAMRDAGMNRAPHAPVKKAKKKPTTQMAGYELQGELVDEGSCGSKSKKKKKGGYGK